MLTCLMSGWVVTAYLVQIWYVENPSALAQEK